jgi:hypothetical protein
MRRAKYQPDPLRARADERLRDRAFGDSTLLADWLMAV